MDKGPALDRPLGGQGPGGCSGSLRGEQGAGGRSPAAPGPPRASELRGERGLRQLESRLWCPGVTHQEREMSLFF